VHLKGPFFLTHNTAALLDDNANIVSLTSAVNCVATAGEHSISETQPQFRCIMIEQSTMNMFLIPFQRSG
jgi:hypothetical protein